MGNYCNTCVADQRLQFCNDYQKDKHETNNLIGTNRSGLGMHTPYSARSNNPSARALQRNSYTGTPIQHQPPRQGQERKSAKSSFMSAS